MFLSTKSRFVLSIMAKQTFSKICGQNMHEFWVWDADEHIYSKTASLCLPPATHWVPGVPSKDAVKLIMSEMNLVALTILQSKL